MPKVQPDPALHQKIQSFVQQLGGNVSEAARLLDVNKASLWRFHDSGMALGTTRKRYRVALDRIREENEAIVSHSSHDEVAIPRSRKPSLDREGRATIRRMCEGLLALLDAYEIGSVSSDQTAGNKNAG